ncbi:MAG: peptidoglycan DD-metalloendopeptidase family protein [Clostridia bacterium]|nr:peptidoglycan DD-metalloendopeptidase family protein [Clostridia bacterium]
MMKKKILSLLLIFAMVFSFVSVMPEDSAYADDEGRPLTEEELREQMQNAQNDMNDLVNEKDAIGAQITALCNEIDKIKEQIDLLDTDIKTLQEQIKQKEEEIVKKIEEIEIQEKNLNARLKAMYKNGTVNFVDVLLGSKSISELVYNIKMVRMIHEYDVEVVEILQHEHEELERIKAELEEAKAELDKKRDELASQKAEKDAKVSDLRAKQEVYDAQIADLKNLVRDLASELTGYVGGEFVWPLPSYTRHSWYITSWVGWRLHPIYHSWRFHGGTDIAAGTGTPIYACGVGTVIKSSNYSNYGLTVMIDHGDGVVSLYAHCSKLIAQVGQVVAPGDKIAEVGMTGAATGPHLHFEVMIHGDEQDSMKYFPDIEAYRPSDVIL